MEPFLELNKVIVQLLVIFFHFSLHFFETFGLALYSLFKRIVDLFSIIFILIFDQMVDLT